MQDDERYQKRTVLYRCSDFFPMWNIQLLPLSTEVLGRENFFGGIYNYFLKKSFSEIPDYCMMLRKVPGFTSLWWRTTQVLFVFSFHQISCVPPVARRNTNPKVRSFLITKRYLTGCCGIGFFCYPETINGKIKRIEGAVCLDVRLSVRGTGKSSS